MAVMAEEPLTAAVLHDALARLEGRIGKRLDVVDGRLGEIDGHLALEERLPR
jgi:hypothetical protein